LGNETNKLSKFILPRETRIFPLELPLYWGSKCFTTYLTIVVLMQWKSFESPFILAVLFQMQEK
jgi:hypothetical protein